MTLKEFIDKWNGKKADFDGAFNGQCVDLFRFYCKEVLEIQQPKSVTGAADFWTNYASDPNLNENFEQIKNTPDFIPKSGDVMVWNKKAGGGFGHIGMVADNNGNVDGFTSFDQNWFKISVCELVKHSYSSVYGVLRPKVQSGQFCLPAEEYKQLKIERDLYVKFKDSGFPSVEDVKRQISERDQQLSDVRRELGESRTGESKAQDDSRQYREKYEKLIEDQVYILDPVGTHQIQKDEISINNEIRRLITVEDDKEKLQKEYDEKLKVQAGQFEQTIDSLERQITQLRQDIEKWKQKATTLSSPVVTPEQIEGIVTKIWKFVSKIWR